MTLPRIAVVGAGRMGRGLAHAFAYTGHDVRLIDLKDREGTSPLAAARDEIAATVGLMRRIGTIDDAQRAARRQTRSPMPPSSSRACPRSWR